jgi:hypothetical protein
MKIIVDRPPMFDEIDARFHIANKSVIFAWGDTIYNPTGVEIAPQLLAHEAVHGQRQGSDTVGWWHQYIDSKSFRLAEEIPAHQAEYNWLLNHSLSRQARRSALKVTARRLAAPLYGSMTTVAKAKRMLTNPS